MKKKGRYDLKIKEEKGPAAQRGTDIHKQFEEAILNGCKLPAKFNFYSDYIDTLRNSGAQPELKAAVNRAWQPCDFDSPDAWIVSVLDLWLVRGSTAYGWDWKTGKEYPDHVKQKEFYTCVMADTCPEVDTFVFNNVYLDQKLNRPHTFLRSELTNLRERWQNRIEMMERDTVCAPTPNFFCRYCAVSKAKGGPCPF